MLCFSLKVSSLTKYQRKQGVAAVQCILMSSNSAFREFTQPSHGDTLNTNVRFLKKKRKRRVI